MAKGHLKYAMLKYLEREPLSGYGIMKRIKEQSGDWHPSFGSIYPHLKSMYKEGYLKTKQKGRSILYEITPAGKEALKVMDEENKDYLKDMLSKIKGCYPVEGKFEEQALSYLQNIQQGVDPFKDFNTDIMAIKAAMFDLWDRKLLEKHKKQIINILQKATKDMERLS